jgi:hypothetical protein
MSRARGITRVAWRVVAVAGLVLIAHPPGTTAVVDWVAAHDRIDVPYVRDCHGVFRRPEECPGGTEARER